MIRPHLLRRSILILLVLLASCTHPPPNLSPAGTDAFHKLRVIKGLDLLRDTAIDANRQVPPLISEDLTRRIVLYHRSALITLKASEAGWPTTVATGLTELVKALPPAQAQLLGPYVALLTTILQEIPR